MTLGHNVGRYRRAQLAAPPRRCLSRLTYLLSEYSAGARAIYRAANIRFRNRDDRRTLKMRYLFERMEMPRGWNSETCFRFGGVQRSHQTFGAYCLTLINDEQGSKQLK